MPESRTLRLADAAATQASGARLGQALALADDSSAFVVNLSGELGSGKTTLVRGALRSLGIADTIRSPTYALIENYSVDGRTLAHLDLYRLSSPGELETLGVRDLLLPGHLLFVEWPERGAGALPEPDVALRLHFQGEARTLHVEARSERGRAVVQEWFR